MSLSKTYIEKEIIKAIKIEDKNIRLSVSHEDWENGFYPRNYKGLDTLIKFVRKLFKED